jgi:hypothetical protein
MVNYEELITDIILIDIIGFSKLDNHQQLGTVMKLGESLKGTLASLTDLASREVSEIVRGFIPTGDGTYVVLQPEFAGFGIFLSLGLRNALIEPPKRRTPQSLRVRIAAHTGVAIPFTDLTGKENFVGDGLNDTARLLSLPPNIQDVVTAFAGDDNFVIASIAAIEQHGKVHGWEPQFYEAVQFRKSETQRFKDKHGREHAFHVVECARSAVFAPPRVRKEHVL